jgi:HEAT repeat protein
MPLIRSQTREAAVSQEPAGADRPVEEQLRSADPRARLEAVRRAARAGEVDLLVRTLKSEGASFVREAILTSLARRADARAIAALAELIGDEDPRLRNDVIETLSYMGEEVIDCLAPMLDSEDHNIRIYVLTVLSMIKNPRAALIALKTAQCDDNVNVCAAALEVVAASGSPDLIRALRSIPSRFPNQPYLAFAVRAALSQIE